MPLPVSQRLFIARKGSKRSNIKLFMTHFCTCLPSKSIIEHKWLRYCWIQSIFEEIFGHFLKDYIYPYVDHVIKVISIRYTILYVLFCWAGLMIDILLHNTSLIIVADVVQTCHVSSIMWGDKPVDRRLSFLFMATIMGSLSPSLRERKKTWLITICKDMKTFKYMRWKNTGKLLIASIVSLDFEGRN